jgi:hypothetical protein
VRTPMIFPRLTCATAWTYSDRENGTTVVVRIRKRTHGTNRSFKRQSILQFNRSNYEPRTESWSGEGVGSRGSTLKFDVQRPFSLNPSANSRCAFEHCTLSVVKRFDLRRSGSAPDLLRSPRFNIAISEHQ